MSTPLYLDAGSASMILQMIGGGVVAVIVAARLFWERILRILHIRTADPETHPETRPTPGPSPR